MTVNFNQKEKIMFITPATKKKQKQKTTEPVFYTYHTDSVNQAASMKLEFFFQPIESYVFKSIHVAKN